VCILSALRLALQTARQAQDEQEAYYPFKKTHLPSLQRRAIRVSGFLAFSASDHLHSVLIWHKFICRIM
jgi:hypothetical protein